MIKQKALKLNTNQQALFFKMWNSKSTAGAIARQFNAPNTKWVWNTVQKYRKLGYELKRRRIMKEVEVVKPKEELVQTLVFSTDQAIYDQLKLLTERFDTVVDNLLKANDKLHEENASLRVIINRQCSTLAQLGAVMELGREELERV